MSGTVGQKPQAASLVPEWELTPLRGLSVALLVDLLHLLQELAHVEAVRRPWGSLQELVHQLHVDRADC